jgi:hypothetical protein
VKKLISIGVALALLTMAVVPGVAAAYDPPPTYSKVPFAIIQSGVELMGQLLDILGPELELPPWLNSSLTDPIAEWAGGPLSWTVDMLAWGMSLGGTIFGMMSDLLGDIPIDLEELFNTIACGLMTCWSATNCTGNFTPCA